MIQQPYYTLADLNEEERQVYNERVAYEMECLEKYKIRYVRSDLELFLTRHIRYCNNVIKNFNQHIELDELGIEVPFLSNGLMPDKLDYIFAVEYLEKYENELRKLQVAKQEKPRGRNTDADFKSCVCDPAVADDVLEELHKKADGKKGKLFAYIICAAVKANLIIKPSYNQCDCEFEDIGSKQGYSRYINEANSSNADTQILQPLVTYFMEIKKSVI